MFHQEPTPVSLNKIDNISPAAGIYEVSRSYLVSVRVHLENLAGFGFLTHYSIYILLK